jgi:hypothetical protein
MSFAPAESSGNFEKQFSVVEIGRSIGAFSTVATNSLEERGSQK